MKKLLTLLFFFYSAPLMAEPSFFLMGSGEIYLKNVQTGAVAKVRYRKGEDQYLEEALKKINAVYGSSAEDEFHRMSLRFLELLAYLQNHFNGAAIEILSGYRSPELNQALRRQGKLAALSSMHLEGAAADLRVAGVPISEVQSFARALPCCGVGYYHGKHIHLDTGPKRWWDEKTSGTEKKEAQENEKIIALTQKDIYLPSENIHFDFERVSDYPFGIENQITLEKFEGGQWKSQRKEEITSSQSCLLVQERKEGKNLILPNMKKNDSGRWRVGISFCGKHWSKMPASIYSNEFEIR